jgi:predicted transcriptional regulator of viral defense system
MKYHLGPLESKLIFSLEEEEKFVFTASEARTLLNCSDGVLWKILHRLKQKGRIEEIRKGEYLLVPARAGYITRWTEHPFFFVDYILDEYYVGYWTALNYWQMTEQIPWTIFIATTKRKRNFEFNEVTYFRFVTISRHKFFGWKMEKFGGKNFRISDKEKTIVDSLDLPEYAGGIPEVAKGLYSELDWGRLVEYANRLSNSAVHKRLGFLSECLNIRLPDRILTDLQSSIRPGYSWLDPTAPKRARRYNSKWKIKINLPDYVFEGKKA